MVDHCSCGKGDEAPAIVHADSCPCIDWVSGELEGTSKAPWIPGPDDIAKMRTGEMIYYNEEDDANV